MVGNGCRSRNGLDDKVKQSLVQRPSETSGQGYDIIAQVWDLGRFKTQPISTVTVPEKDLYYTASRFSIDGYGISGRIPVRTDRVVEIRLAT
jgi:hypothetical protein